MEHAILMAAGLGKRMRPLTEKTPKPLLQVNGQPMIETVISGLLSRGVNTIYIVTGWLGEQFHYLCEKYKHIEIIENPDFETANNISSIYYACGALENADCFICEADLYVTAPAIFQAELPGSCYYGKYAPGSCDDWVFATDEKGYISRIGKGGRSCFQMVGISYFRKQDAAALAEVIRGTYSEKRSKQLFWDEAVDRNLDRLRLQIHQVSEGQVIEIDTPEELEAVNSRFSGNGTRR